MRVAFLTFGLLLFFNTVNFAQTTWNGAIDNDWNNAGNWSAGVPTTPYANSITINGTGSPTLPSDFTADALVLNDGADLNLNGNTLTVNTSFDTEDTDNAKTIRNGTLNVGTSSSRADVSDIRGLSFGAGLGSEVCNISFYTASTTRFQRLRANNFYGSVLFDIETGTGSNWAENEGNTFYDNTQILISGNQDLSLGTNPTNPNTFKAITTITNNGERRIYIGNTATLVSSTDYTTIFENDVNFINNASTSSDGNAGFYIHWNKAQTRFESKISVRNNSAHFRSNYWWNTSSADGECSLGNNAYFDIVVSGGSAFITSFTQNSSSTVTHSFEVQNDATLDLANNLDFPTLYKSGNCPFPADVELKVNGITGGNGIRVARPASSNVSFGGDVIITNTSSLGRVTFGENDGNVSIASGKIFNASTSTDGLIYLLNVLQTAGISTHTHDFTSGNASRLLIIGSTLHGNLIATGNELRFRKNTIGSGINAITLTKTGSTATDCGGNTFKGDLTLTMEASVTDRWRWGWDDGSSNGGADIVEQNLTVNSHSTNEGYIALTLRTANNQYNSLGGNTIFNLSNRGRIMLGGWEGTTRSFTMGGNLTVNNASTHPDGEGSVRIGSHSTQVITGTISGNVTINHTGTSNTLFAEASGSTLNIGGDIDLNMTADGQIRFGDNGGVTIPAMNSSIDASSTTDGLIVLQNVNQTTGGTPTHNFTTNVSTGLFFADNTLHGNFSALGDRMHFRRNTIGSNSSNIATLTLPISATTAEVNGGNTFNGVTTINHNANGLNWFWGHSDAGADVFNADVTFTNNSDSELNIAHNTLNNIFNGISTFDNAGSGIIHLTMRDFANYVATADKSAIFNGNAVFINSSAGGAPWGRGNGIGIARNGGARVTFNADVSFTNNASSGTDGDIAVGTSGEVTFGGNITVTQNGTSSAFTQINHNGTTGRVFFNGTTDQTISSNEELAFRYLELNKTVGTKLILDSNTLIRRAIAGANADAELIINSGHIELGNYNLTLEYDATYPANLTGGDANNYIITNGAGYLNMRVEGTNKLFPIGSASSYLPITLNNNGGTNDNYSVRAIYDTYETYNASNNPTGTDITEYFVNNAWAIQEDVIGGSNLVVTPQWNASDELTNFNRSLASVNRFNHDSNEWNCGGADAAATGANPYTLSSCAFNSTSTNNVGVISLASTVADAGSTITTGGCGSATLNANVPAGTGPGTWTLVSQPSGASASIALPNNPNTAVSGMTISGTYTFRWTTQKTSNCATCTSQQDDVNVIYTYSPPTTNTSATWTGLANNGDWNDCLNWASLEIPDATGASVTIPNIGTYAYPILPNDVNIINLDIQAGAELDLNGFTLFFSGTSNVAGADINCNNGTFEKTGTSNDTWIGGNTFTGDITFRHSGAGGTWILAGTNPDDFNPASATLNNTITFDIAHASANIIPAYNGNTTIEGSIIINSVANADFHFGNIVGSTGGITLDGGNDSHNRITTIDNNLPTGQKIVYYNFTMNKNTAAGAWDGGVEVDGISHVQNLLTMNFGHIKILGNAIFSLQNNAPTALQPNSTNANSMILPEATGVFGRQVLNNASDYVFPIARHGYNGTLNIDRRFWKQSFEYTLNLGVGSDADEFFIRLDNSGGNPKATYDLSNTGSGANLNQEYINNTWIVTHANTSANFDAIVKVFWYHDEPWALYEQATFEPTRAFISRYDYTTSEWECLQTATAATQTPIGTPVATNRENRLALTTGVNKASDGNFGVFSVASATADVSNTSTSQSISCGNIALDASAIFASAAEGVWTTTASGVTFADPTNPITTAVGITSSGTYDFTWTRESADCGSNIHSETVSINVTIGGTASTTQTWTGIKNTDWFDCANWTDGVPTNTTDVIIPNEAPRYPVLTGDVTIQSLTFDNNGTTTGATINFAGFNLNTGTLNVKDWTTGTVDRSIGTGTGTLNVDGRFTINGRSSRAVFDVNCNLANLAGDTDYSYIYDADFNNTIAITNRKTSTWEGIFIGNDPTDITNFNNTVTFTIDSPSSIRIARDNSTVNFAENVIFTSTANATGAEARLQLGSDGGNQGIINLADGKTLTTNSFVSGRLWISQVTQTGIINSHTHNLDQNSPAELRLRNNILLGNFEATAAFMEFRGNTFNSLATNTTTIVGNTETDRDTESGGNTFRGETWITNSGRGVMYFGGTNGGNDIFETDAHFIANENASPVLPNTRTTNYRTNYNTTFSTTFTTTHPNPVDYIAPPYYVYGTDPATWSGTKVGFASYPRPTNLPTNTADPVTNANNAATNAANDAANKADESTSESNISTATANVSTAVSNANTAENNLTTAVADADAVLASIAGDAGYLDPAYNSSMIPLYNALQTIRNTGNTYIPTVTTAEANADADANDTSNPPGDDNVTANNTNTVANQAHTYVNQIYAAINALHNEVNTQNAAYNATLDPLIDDANNVGILALAHSTTGNEFRGNTDFNASNKARIFIAQDDNATAVFQGTTLIENSSEGGSGNAYLISDDPGANVIFQDVVTINQNGTGYIRSGEEGNMTFQENLIINNLGGGNTIVGENNDGGIITIEKDIITDLSAGYIELSSIQKTSTTPLSIEAKNDAYLLMRGTSNIQGNITLIDNSTDRGIRVAWNTGNVITFEEDVTLRNQNTGEIIISNQGTTNFNGNIILENTYAMPNNWNEAIRFGTNALATTNLADGNTISIGANGFAKGELELHYFNQLGTTPQYIQLHDGTFGNITSEAQLSVNTANFQAVATFEAAELLVNDSEFHAETTLIAWENGENSGGNIFNDKAFYEFRGTNTGWNIGRGGAGDTYYDDVQFWNNGNNSFMAIADEGPSNTFFGTQVTIINGNGTATGCDFSIARLTTSVAEFDSNVIIDNRDADGSITLGEQGDVIFKQSVTLINSLTGQWEGDLVLGGWSTGTYNGSVTFEATSSFALDASTTWEDGDLIMRNTHYQPTTPLNITLNSAVNNTLLYLGPNSIFESDFSSNSGGVYLNGATFNGTATFEKSGPHWRNTSEGGNVFNGTTHIINHSEDFGEILLASTNPDDYNADVTFELINPSNNRRGWIIPAYRNTASFAGNVTIVSDVDDDFYFSGTGGYTPSSGAGTGAVRFDGTGTQTVTNNIVNPNRTIRYRKIEMYQGNATDLLQTNRDFTVTDFCEFSSGKIDIGANDMTIENSNNGTSVLVLNVNASHVLATSTGEVKRTVNNNNSNVIFPVGTIGTYLPATINLDASGTTDVYNARLIDNVYQAYGAAPTFIPSGAAITAQFTRRTWVISEDVAGGTQADLTLQWDPADELPNFDRNLVGVVQYNNATSKWRCTQTAGAATGTPGLNLRRSTSNITFMGAFSVATINADAGPDQTLCGPGDVSMAAQELVTPFSGTWVYISGPTDYVFDDANVHNTNVTLPSANSTYVFEWHNNGLEGTCGAAISQVSIDVGSGTTGPAPAFVTWTGTQDSNWFNCNNWTPNYIPDASISAVIPDVSILPNQPVIETAGPACNDLTIENGGHIQLNNVGILEIAGNAEIQAGGSINNSASFTEVRVTGSFTNAGIIQNTNLITIGANFTQNGTLNQNLATAEIRLTGNLVSNVAMNFTQGKFLLRGSSDTEISGTGSLNFFNLEVDKTAGFGVNLSKAVSLSGSLFLTNGIIYTSSTNLLSLRAGAISTAGNAGSYVNGPMRKIGNTPFTFPVGKGGYWARIGISDLANTNVNDYFTAEYFHYAYGDLTVNDLNHVSSIEHWILDRNPSGTTEAKVTLFWESGTRSEIIDVSIDDLKVAHYDSAPMMAWHNRGGVISGSAAQGNITTTARQSVFSPWTFGSTTGVNPLPVSLISFEAEKADDYKARIFWSTAIEENVRHFEVERSANAIDFEQIHTVEAVGNSQTQKDYEVFDESPLLGINYYRLKMVDEDGSFEYSPMRSLEFAGGLALSWDNIYPNPFHNILNVAFNIAEGRTYQISIYDIQGRLVKAFKTEIATEARVRQQLNLSDLADQTYILKIRTAKSEIIERIVKQ